MKTILAAVDFSPVTKRVVAEAVGLARAARARVILLNVTTPKALAEGHAAWEGLLDGVDPQSTNGDGAERAKIHGDAQQLVGDPIAAILEQAERCSADYVVLGSHGHTALFEVIVGGTAAGVIRGAKCPVMVIPSRTRKGNGRSGRRARRSDPAASPQAFAPAPPG